MSETLPEASTAAARAAQTRLGAWPAAAVRTQVTVPLRFADGYATTGRVFTFDGLADGREHLALGLGDWQHALDRSARGGPAPLVRPHSECLTGDVLGSLRCDCGPQLREAVEHISRAGGFLLYLRQEGRGIGLYAKLDAYALQDAGLDTYEANLALGRGEDERDYTAAAQMLRALGTDRIALLSNNPDKAVQLDRLGVRVTERIPTGVHLSEANVRYLAAKVDRAAHTLNLPPARLTRSRSMTAVITSRAEIATEAPARYAKQLVAHLGHRIAFTTDGSTSTATFGSTTGQIVVGDGVLTLLAVGTDEAGVARVEQVLGSHLERFGQRKELAVTWIRTIAESTITDSSAGESA